MKSRAWITVWLVMLLIVSLGAPPLSAAQDAQPPTVEEVRAAIAEGVAWLAGQQNEEGQWPREAHCAVTALAVKKLEHHAVDPKWGLGLGSPFDDSNPYKANIEAGWTFLFEACVDTTPIDEQLAGDPDTNGNGIGARWGWYHTYTSSIVLMALCEAVEMDRVVVSGPLAGWTYEQAAQDTMDYLAYGQVDEGQFEGGWGYSENESWADNSNTGWVTLGLGFAEAASPQGCGFEVPQFVKDELKIWIDYIQNATGNGWYAEPLGGSGYTHSEEWVNILKTGNLLQQMAFVGDSASASRVQQAVDYMERHWEDADQDPGWRGDGYSSSYQATFTAMKGFTGLGIHQFGDPPIDWQADFETELLAEQYEDGHWDGCEWGDDVRCTEWALLTLQKVAPPVYVPVDIKPTSCPNPLNVYAKGKLPIAILGLEDLDATCIDPATVQLVGVSPVRWAMEDVATPFEPFAGKENAYDCTKEGADGYMDLTLKFNAQEVVAALGEVSDRDVLALPLTGMLTDECGSLPFEGEDVVVILKHK